VLGSVPDQGFPPGFFDDAEDEEAINQAEIDREDAWDEAHWQKGEQNGKYKIAMASTLHRDFERPKGTKSS